MFAEFVPLFLIALLGSSEVTAQLEFGIYKIINRVSQTTLCSHGAGAPIYVHAQGYPYACESWALGPGHGDGFYTVKNTRLNLFVSANKTSGPAVENHGATSFVVSSAGGRDYTIRLPDSDLVWTIEPTIISYSDILLKPENGDDTQLWTFIPADDTIYDSPSAVQARSFEESKHGLVAVRSDIDNVTWSQRTPAVGTMWSYGLYATLDVVVAGKYKGHGTAFGVGVAQLLMQLTGTLRYDSEDTLLSAENEINIVGVGGMMVVRFRIGGQLVGTFAFGDAGFGITHTVANGTFIWIKD